LKLPQYCINILKKALFKLEVYGVKIYIHPEVYAPSDDTYLLLESLSVPRNAKFLDMGSGTGIVGIYAALHGASFVISIDVNTKASLITQCNAYLNGVPNIVNSVNASLFETLRKKLRFDIIAFNPPYLPVKDKGLLERAWSGGKSGRKIIDRFLNNVSNYLKDNGTLFLVQSSLSNPDKTMKFLRGQGFKTEIVRSKRFFFEEILVIKAYRRS